MSRLWMRAVIGWIALVIPMYVEAVRVCAYTSGIVQDENGIIDTEYGFHGCYEYGGGDRGPASNDFSYYAGDYGHFFTPAVTHSTVRSSPRSSQAGHAGAATGLTADRIRGDQIESDKKMDPCPVVLSTGEKHLFETDYVGTEEMPLSITRKYSSIPEFKGSAVNMGIFGSGWSSPVDTKLVIVKKDTTVCSYVPGYEEMPLCPVYPYNDVKQIYFVKDGTVKEFKPSGDGNSFVPESGGAGVSAIEKIVFTNNRFTYTAANGSRYSFSHIGRIDLITNLHGIQWTFNYNQYNALVSIKHSNGNQLQFEWRYGSSYQERWLARIRLPGGTYVNYAYDLNKGLVKVVYPGNTGTVEYGYDFEVAGNSAKRHLTSKSIDGKLWGVYELRNYKAEASGLVDGVNQSVYDYNAGSTTATNAKGGVKTYQYDESGRLTSVEKDSTSVCPGSSSTIQYVSATSSNIKFKEDWNGNRTSYTYYANDNIKYEYAKGITKEHTWDAYGRLTSLKVWDGAKMPSFCAASDPCPTPRTEPALVQEFIYDSSATYKNRLKQVRTKALKFNSLEYTPQRIFTYQYGFNGNIVTKKSIDGPAAGNSDITTFAYNGVGYLTRITDAKGNATTFLRNTLTDELPIGIRDPNGLTTRFKYDAKGRITQLTVEGPSPTVTSFTYYGDDQIKRITYPEGAFREFLLDGARRIR